MTKTNFNQVRACLTGKSTYFGCGKSYAIIHKIAWEIMSGARNVLVNIKTRHHLKYLEPMTHEIFEEYGLDYSFRYSDSTAVSEDSFIRFIPDERWDDRIRGFDKRSTLFIYMDR